MTMQWDAAFKTCPLVAILRGVTPEEILPIVDQLVEHGFTLIEIPLNSPRPLDSVRLAAETFGHRALIGAGTVLEASQVRAVQEAGGRLIVAPNFEPRVAAEAVRLRLAYSPGVATPSEAFAALEAGATFLKLFPAEMIPPAAVKAIRAVLPKETRLLPVGGITAETMKPYLSAGADGFGLGSAIYKPGFGPREVAAAAAAFQAALRRHAQIPEAVAGA